MHRLKQIKLKPVYGPFMPSSQNTDPAYSTAPVVCMGACCM